MGSIGDYPNYFISPHTMIDTTKKKIPAIKEKQEVDLSLKPLYPEHINIKSISVKKTKGIASYNVNKLKNIIACLHSGLKKSGPKRVLVEFLLSEESIKKIKANNELLDEQKKAEKKSSVKDK